MRSFSLTFFLLTACCCFGQQKFQLAPPLLKYSSIFFDERTKLEMKFDQPGATIRYTINGKEPTEEDLVYTAPITITGKQITVKAKAIGKEFMPSETVSVAFFKQGKPVKKIEFSSPNPKYPGSGVNTLNDNIGGLLNFSGGTWLGYDRDTVELDIELEKSEKISAVLVSMLQNESSWIFLPGQILVYYYDMEKNTYQPLAMEAFSSEVASTKQCRVQEIVARREAKTNRLKLILLPVKKIPDWHSGKGNHAWLFIDEIKVY